MVIKQTQQELYKNALDFYDSIKPVKLAIIPTTSMTPEQTSNARANGTLFDLWLQKNVQDAEGVVDYSVENFRKAYKAMRDSGTLTFDVAPVHKAPEQSSRLQQMNHAAPKEEGPKKKGPVELAAEAAHRANLNRMWHEAQQMVDTYRGRTHSGTARARVILQGILDRAKEGPSSPAAALAAKEALKKKGDELWG